MSEHSKETSSVAENNPMLNNQEVDHTQTVEEERDAASASLGEISNKDRGQEKKQHQAKDVSVKSKPMNTGQVTKQFDQSVTKVAPKVAKKVIQKHYKANPAQCSSKPSQPTSSQNQMETDLSDKTIKTEAKPVVQTSSQDKEMLQTPKSTSQVVNQSKIAENRQLSSVSTTAKEYRKFMFMGVVYCVGEFALFRETQKTSIVGRILKIIPEGGCLIDYNWPMIQVQWYYKKIDLDIKTLNLAEEDLRFIGDNEVFPSRHKDIVFADAIVSKCEVFSIKKYDEIESTDVNTTFFTRASYCPLRKVLKPSFTEWERYCICNKPLNPNMTYIKCDKCNLWHHPQCQDLTHEQIEILEEFYCKQCHDKSFNGTKYTLENKFSSVTKA